MNLRLESRTARVIALTTILLTGTTAITWSHGRYNSQSSPETQSTSRTTPSTETLSLYGLIEEAKLLQPHCIKQKDAAAVSRDLHSLAIGFTSRDRFFLPETLSGEEKMKIEGERMTTEEKLRQHATEILQKVKTDEERVKRLAALYASTAQDQLKALEQFDPKDDSLAKADLRDAALCSIASAGSLDSAALSK